jgi:hypothetical protein
MKPGIQCVLAPALEVLFHDVRRCGRPADPGLRLLRRYGVRGHRGGGGRGAVKEPPGRGGAAPSDGGEDQGGKAQQEERHRDQLHQPVSAHCVRQDLVEEGEPGHGQDHHRDEQAAEQTGKRPNRLVRASPGRSPGDALPPRPG